MAYPNITDKLSPLAAAAVREGVSLIDLYRAALQDVVLPEGPSPEDARSAAASLGWDAGQYERPSLPDTLPRMTIAVMLPGQPEAGRLAWLDAFREAAEEEALPVRLLFRYYGDEAVCDGRFYPEEFLQTFRGMSGEGLDGFILYPIHSVHFARTVAPIAAGRPVVLIDNFIADELTVPEGAAVVSRDHRIAGELLGEFASQFVSDEGGAAVVSRYGYDLSVPSVPLTGVPVADRAIRSCTDYPEKEPSPLTAGCRAMLKSRTGQIPSHFYLPGNTVSPDRYLVSEMTAHYAGHGVNCSVIAAHPDTAETSLRALSILRNNDLPPVRKTVVLASEDCGEHPLLKAKVFAPRKDMASAALRAALYRKVFGRFERGVFRIAERIVQY